MLIFQKRLRETRKKRHLSQEEVGIALHISKNEICNYEIGKRIPPLEMLIKLADFLEVDFLWLIGQEIELKREKDRTIKLSDLDLKILRAIKESDQVYMKFLKDPGRAVKEMEFYLKKQPNE